jgi:hypothetical protein
MGAPPQLPANLERACTNFFSRRAQFPRFKKRGRFDSFRYPGPKQIKLSESDSRIFLPKLGWSAIETVERQRLQVGAVN